MRTEKDLRNGLHGMYEKDTRVEMIPRFSAGEKEGWCYLPLKEETQEKVLAGVF